MAPRKKRIRDGLTMSLKVASELLASKDARSQRNTGAWGLPSFRLRYVTVRFGCLLRWNQEFALYGFVDCDGALACLAFIRRIISGWRAHSMPFSSGAPYSSGWR
jgi:hypothetical protein